MLEKILIYKIIVFLSELRLDICSLLVTTNKRKFGQKDKKDLFEMVIVNKCPL